MAGDQSRAMSMRKHRNNAVRRIIDYLIYLIVGIVVVSLYWWAMMSGLVDLQGIEFWSTLGLSSGALVWLSCESAGHSRRRRWLFWLLLLGLLTAHVMIVLIAFRYRGSIDIVRFAWLFPVEIVFFSFLMMRLVRPRE
jgi:MYXO-CTERM domain-containing protein